MLRTRTRGKAVQSAAPPLHEDLNSHGHDTHWEFLALQKLLRGLTVGTQTAASAPAILTNTTHPPATYSQNPLMLSARGPSNSVVSSS